MAATAPRRPLSMPPTVSAGMLHPAAEIPGRADKIRVAGSIEAEIDALHAAVATVATRFTELATSLEPIIHEPSLKEHASIYPDNGPEAEAGCRISARIRETRELVNRLQGSIEAVLGSLAI